MSRSSPFDRRRAGLLLHPTSLPGSYNSGVLGLEAYRFLDFMAACGFTVWQTLPLGPTQEDLSPYSAQSVHAGNPSLISLEQLIDIGLLKQDNGPSTTEDGWSYQKRRLVEAHRSFQESGISQVEYDEFLHHNHYWLDDYALFQTIRTTQGYSSWVRWPQALRDRHPQEIAEVFRSSKDNIEQCRFEQFLFYQQWSAIKRYLEISHYL
jgi:4-alpha-glucanotransferase